MTNKINEVFDIEVVEVTEVLPPAIIPKSQPPTIKPPDKLETALIDDLNASRQDFDTIIELGKTALEKVLEIAEEGQHPRFFEAAAMLIKSVNEANKERMDVHVKLSEIRKNQAVTGNGPNINVDKGVFVGTTKELLELINPRAAKKIEKSDDEHNIST